MKRTTLRVTSVLLLIMGAGAGLGWTVAQNRRASPPPEHLLPQESVLYLGYDGLRRHQEAWQQTAAHAALVESGLYGVVEKVMTTIGRQAERDPQAAEVFALVKRGLEHLYQDGVSVAVSLPEQAGPFGVVVLHDAADLQGAVLQLINEASGGEVQTQESEVAGRAITRFLIPNVPVEAGCWVEGSHLVVAAGIGALEQAVAIADGQTPNITNSPLWQQYRTAADFEVTSTGWLNVAELRERFGAMPVPMPPDARRDQPVRISEIMQALGLDTLERIAGRGGFQGKSCISETDIVAPAPRRGLLALMDQTSFTMEDLPPLPARFSGVWASSFDWAEAYSTILGVVENVADLGPPRAQADIDKGLGEIRRELGIDLKADLFEPLGDLACVYGDSGQGWFGMGFGLTVQVDDADRLRTTVNQLLAVLEREARGDVNVRRVYKQGRELLMLELKDAPLTPTLCIDKDWACVGLTPQVIETFLMRVDGKLTSWQPSAEFQEALAAVPQKFTSISLSDPRPMYQTLLSMGPFMASGAIMALKQNRAIPRDFELPITVADIPPAELVTGPLFPNVMVNTLSAEGLRTTTRSSVPGIPLMAGGGDGSSVATTGVLVALLLPAIQQAREAARRTQSMNNLKQIAIALHNYHETHGHFPYGTHPNDDLEPHERLSWQYDILPFLEQSALYHQMDGDAAWDAEANAPSASIGVPTYLNPSMPLPPSEYALTNYVGIAGVGADQPARRKDDVSSGIFGYYVNTRIRDILDGTSNTIMTSETNDGGPWAAGGRGTVRAFTKQPYINGPDGFGGKHPGGCIMGFADGSVRFISEHVDPTLLEALATKAGGETIGDF